MGEGVWREIREGRAPEPEVKKTEGRKTGSEKKDQEEGRI